MLLKIKVEISPFFLITLIYVLYFKAFYQFIFLFLFVFFHEMAHYFVATVRGYRPESIQILPFGTSLKFNALQNINSIDEILIAGVGPLFNAILGTIMLIGDNSFFAAFNFTIAAFNILPVFPLDGGRMLRAILIRNFNYIHSTRIVCKVTKVVSIATFVISIYNIYYSWYSFFLAFLFVYIFLNADNQEYFTGFIGVAERFKKKNELYKAGMMKINGFGCSKNLKVKELINEFLPEYYNIIYVLDEKMNLKYTITETKLIELMTNLSYECTIEDVIRKMEEISDGNTKG